MLVTPAAAASLLTRRLPVMMGVGAAIGAASAIVGLYLSYYTNLPSGPAIVLTATAFFFVALVFGRRRSPQRGLPPVFSPLRYPYKQQSGSHKPAASSCTPPSRSAAHSPGSPTPLRRPVEEVVGGPSAGPSPPQASRSEHASGSRPGSFPCSTRWWRQSRAGRVMRLGTQPRRIAETGSRRHQPPLSPPRDRLTKSAIGAPIDRNVRDSISGGPQAIAGGCGPLAALGVLRRGEASRSIPERSGGTFPHRPPWKGGPIRGVAESTSIRQVVGRADGC